MSRARGKLNMPPTSEWRREPRDCSRCGIAYAPTSNSQKVCPSCKTCPQCGKQTSHAALTYCSRECYAESRRFSPIPCGHCGGKVARVRSRKAVYCSPECRNAVHYGKTAKDSNGYLRERTPNGWELQHRVVMARELGRGLLRSEAVHHRNGIRTDNRIENLELCLVGARRHPPGQRVEDLVVWARGILDEYEDVVTALRTL